MSNAEDPQKPPRPWWIPPIFGGVPEGVTREHLQVLGFVSFAMLFENYDLGLLSAALRQISESFALDNVSKGTLLGMIEFGALAAFLIVPFADRIGRRPVLLACIVGMSLGSLATAFAPNAAAFAACQIVTRSFATTASVVSIVIVSEEFPAAHRGWGLGMLGAVGAVGFGLAALVYSQVELLPFGWRAIYAVGGLAVFLLPFFRRNIRETRRFHDSRGAARSVGMSLANTLRPVLELAREHPRRAILLGLAAGLATAGHRPAFRFVSDFLQTEHGWSPGEFATLYVIGGTLGVIGSPLVGRLGDRIGRRQLGAAMLVPFPLVVALFYVGMGPGAELALPWVLMVFVSMASGVMLRALSTELFPTAVRSSAGGWVLLVETLGASVGLFLFAGLEARVADWGLALTLVAALATVGAGFLLFLPDTHRRELEETSLPGAPQGES